MAWTRTTKTIVWGTVSLLMLATVTVTIIFRHDISNRLILAKAESAIASHKFTPVDMTPNYTTPASYFDQITSYPAWGTVPIGFQVFDNVPLQIDGMICLWGAGNANQLKIIFPEEIFGIAVNQKFQTLYVYHGAFFESPDKTPVCEVVFRYADGSSATNQLLYSADILDWVSKDRGKTTIGPTGSRSKLAWVGGTFKPGTRRPLRFCLTAIENPQPATEVVSIDLFSCKSQTAACIMAMTAGKSGLMK